MLDGKRVEPRSYFSLKSKFKSVVLEELYLTGQGLLYNKNWSIDYLHFCLVIAMTFTWNQANFLKVCQIPYLDLLWLFLIDPLSSVIELQKEIGDFHKQKKSIGGGISWRSMATEKKRITKFIVFLKIQIPVCETAYWTGLHNTNWSVDNWAVGISYSSVWSCDL